MMFTKRQMAILHTLQQSRPRERSSLLTSVDGDIIRILSEICLNILRGNVTLSKMQVHRLKRHKQTVRSLAKRNVSIKDKRHQLVQRGGFLPLLLPVIASALGGLISSSQ
jgi:hypothetical protein